MRRARSVVSLSLAVLTASACFMNLDGFTGGGAGGNVDASDATMFDAPADAAPPCEAGSPADPKNCGACGHDCLGGACSDASCQPLVLATSTARPQYVTVDDAHVYFTTSGDDQSGDGGAVMRVEKDGTGLRPLVASAPYANAVLAHGNQVYYATLNGERRIQRVDPDGQNVASLSGYELGPAMMAIDAAAGAIYWINSFDPPTTVRRASLVPGSTVTVASETAPYSQAIAFDEGWIYYSGPSAGTIRRVPKSGCPGGSVCGQTIVPETYSLSVAVDDTYVYWPSTLDGTVHRADKNGQNNVTLSSQLKFPAFVAVDGPWVYFADRTDPGTVRRVKKDASAGFTLANGLANPTAIALDATAIYWTESGSKTGEKGRVVKLAK